MSHPTCTPLRHLADALSAANLACGLASIGAAFAGRFEVCLALLLLGAVFDGLDGAAARRFGGTRIGVYADDVADGMNHGLAPGAALLVARGSAAVILAASPLSGFLPSLLAFGANLQRPWATPHSAPQAPASP